MQSAPKRLTALVLGGFCFSVGTVRASQPDRHYTDRLERHERLSYAPMVSGLIGGDADGETVYSVGAHLRLRHGVSYDSNAHNEAATPLLWTLSAGVDTTRFETVEPSAGLGFQYLPTDCACWNSPIWLNLRGDAALGYRFAESPAPFVSAKLGIGALFSTPVKYLHGGPDTYTYSKLRFLSEADFVVKGQLGFDGEWMVLGGIELDPIRLVPNIIDVFP